MCVCVCVCVCEGGSCRRIGGLVTHQQNGGEKKGGKERKKEEDEKRESLSGEHTTKIRGMSRLCTLFDFHEGDNESEKL